MNKDTERLINVPVKPETQDDKARIYRFQQWLHCLANFAEIHETKIPRDYGLNSRGRPKRVIQESVDKINY